MILAILACVVVVWLALSLLVALLFGRAVKMADVKHRDAMFLRDLGKQPARQVVAGR
jgi:uncharacterized membrane protein affecting hemolysin expression